MLRVFLCCALALAGCAAPTSTPHVNTPNLAEATLDTAKPIQIDPWFWADRVRHQAKNWLSHPTTFNLRLDQMAASHVLELLAQELGVGYDMDQCAQAKVSLHGQDMTLAQIIESLEAQSNSHVAMQGKQLLFRCQTEELRIYHLDYLTTSRSMTDRSSLSSAIASTQRDLPVREDTGNRSELSLLNTQSHDIWQNIALQIEQIIGAAARQSEVITRERQINEAQDRNYASRRTPSLRPSRSDRNSATAVDLTRSDITTTRKEYRSGRVIAHPESASLAVLATPREHQRVLQWLNQMQNRVNRQIVIEALITEISLNERYERGIDWNVLRNNGVRAGLAIQGLNFGNAGTVLQLGRNTGNAETQVVLRLLEEFGQASVLSSPRVVTMNQQPAVLKVIDNRVYFTTDVQTSAPTTNTPAFSVFTTQVQTVPVGFLMTVTPQIANDQTIQLRVRPTLSRIVGFVQDPNPALRQLNIVSEVPEIQTRELESILRLRSGEMALLGGLRQKDNRSLERGIPGSPNALNLLTDSVSRQHNHIELVILLKATTVDAPQALSASAAHNIGDLSGPLRTLNQQLAFGNQLQLAQQHAEARALLELLHHEHPHAPEPAYNLALLHAQQGQHTDALQWLGVATSRCQTLQCDLPLLQVRALLSANKRVVP